MAKATLVDKHLLQALTRAYTARARLFHEAVAASKIDLLIAEIDGIPEESLTWDTNRLGISAFAFAKAKQAGARAHQVFAHPAIISNRPHLVAYYRNLATLSQKGIGQLLFSTSRFEAGKSAKMEVKAAQSLCKTLNGIISGAIDGIADYRLSVSRQAVFAELGAQIQGTWANQVGTGASKAVERLIGDYLESEGMGRQGGAGELVLSNGWTIIFGPEPDVAFLDPRGTKRIAIEIKGSLDTAGAQTRYGEAKKTFAKQIAENPRCHTVYLASCFTDAVIKQIEADGQVRDWFNLTSILYDDNERRRFLERLFHIVRAPR